MAETLKPSFKFFLFESLFSGGLSAFFLFFFVFISWLAFFQTSGLAVLLLLLLAAGVVVIIASWYWAKLYWNSCSITFDKDSVTIRHGVIRKSISTFSYKEIEQVDTGQDLFSAIFSVSALNLYTMSLQSAIAGQIRGFSEKDAQYIKRIVLANKSSKSSKSASSALSAKSSAMPNASTVQRAEKVLTAAVINYKKYGQGIWAIIGFILLIDLLAIVYLLISGAGEAIILVVFYGVFIIPFIFLVHLMQVTTTKFQIRSNEAIVSYSVLVSNSQASMPFASIQDVTVSQGLFERLLGLWSLKVQTGRRTTYSKENAQTVTSVPALSLEEANRLKNILLNKMHSA